MRIEVRLAQEEFNTQYAPLAAILAVYQADRRLQPLESIPIPMKSRDFTPADKLIQVLISILGGCETLSEVNLRLNREKHMATIGRWSRFSDQSNLSRMLDALTQKQIDEIRTANRAIWWSRSQIRNRDWRKYLWLDFDLSGLVCSAEAEESEKGYFSEKKRYWPPISPGQRHS
jgi:hypothetical protein